jgi:hypothetical protein
MPPALLDPAESDRRGGTLIPDEAVDHFRKQVANG